MGVAWVFKRLWIEAPLPAADARAAAVPHAEPAQPRHSACGSAARIFMRRVGGIIFALMVVLWFALHLSVAATGRHRPGDPVQPRRHARPNACSTCSRRSASTGRSRSRSCPGSRRARWRWARSAPCIRCRPRAMRRGRRSSRRSSPTELVARHRVLAAGVVRVRAAMHLDARGRSSRETNSWRYPIVMAAYLFALAYIAVVRHLPRDAHVHGRLTMILQTPRRRRFIVAGCARATRRGRSCRSSLRRKVALALLTPALARVRGRRRACAGTRSLRPPAAAATAAMQGQGGDDR